MTEDRRRFLDTLAAGAVVLGVPALGGGARMPAAPAEPARNRAHEFAHAASHAASRAAAPDAAQQAWDTRWPQRLAGRVKTCFDVPEIESGYGVWRASIWARQYEQVLGIPARELSTALVLRHNAIVLAMQQAFWDRYGLAESSRATHPMTAEPTRRNPALLGATDGLPEPMREFALDRFLARGGIALACDLALQDLVAVVQKADGVSEARATEIARAGLVPGVILQPSGIFAVLQAQQAGALYLRAS